MSDLSQSQPTALETPRANAAALSPVSNAAMQNSDTPTPSKIRLAHSTISTPWRWVLAFLGVLCFVLGGIGAVVPGLPVTVFLLIGSFFLTRSCPWLEEKMFAVPLLRPYAKFIRSTEPMSMTMRRTAWACMWTSILVSITLLAISGRLSWILGGAIFASGVVGTIAISRFRRPS